MEHVQLWGLFYCTLKSPVCHNIASNEISNRWKTWEQDDRRSRLHMKRTRKPGIMGRIFFSKQHTTKQGPRLVRKVGRVAGGATRMWAFMGASSRHWAIGRCPFFLGTSEALLTALTTARSVDLGPCQSCGQAPPLVSCSCAHFYPSLHQNRFP